MFKKMAYNSVKLIRKRVVKMPDIYDKAKRSDVMSKIRSSGNRSTEVKLIGIFKEANISGWRRKYDVKGHPDFVFMQKRVAVFVDGCFWHGHNCRNTVPKGNTDFWNAKISKSMQHDSEVTRLFENRGWKVLRIWEYELKKKKRNELLKKLELYLKP